jgi:hypothetical protein
MQSKSARLSEPREAGEGRQSRALQTTKPLETDHPAIPTQIAAIASFFLSSLSLLSPPLSAMATSSFSVQMHGLFAVSTEPSPSSSSSSSAAAKSSNETSYASAEFEDYPTHRLRRMLGGSQAAAVQSELKRRSAHKLMDPADLLDGEPSGARRGLREERAANGGG